MATGVNVKMGVSGVAQFKQSMNQAKASVKTLDQALALNEKQFKASGDAQTYLQEKADLLQRKMERQREVIESTEKALKAMGDNGVDKASTAFQNMQQNLLRANADLLDTQMQLEGINQAGDDAADGVDEMNHQLKRIGDGVNYQNVTEGLGTITDGMKNVMSKAWQMGEAIVKATLGAGSWADELMTTAAQYEITPEELQRMRKTANLIDTDVETILDAQDKLKKNREQSGKEFMGALAYLGIDPKGKDDLSLFWQAGEAIKNLGKNEDKVTYAQRIFGKSWRELLPLFTAGREEYEKTNASWNVVEQEQLDNLAKMDDAYQNMQNEWDTFQHEIMSAFSGPLTEGMDSITGLFRELNEYLDTPEGQAMLAQIGDTISSLISDLTELNPEEVVAGFKKVVEDVTNALKWIQEHKDDVVLAVKGFIGAWAALETARGVSVALSLINGIGGLLGTGAASAGAAGAAAGASWGASFGAAIMKASPFLAFLYTLLNPSGGEDNVGNSELIDKNGNLTKEAIEYGYYLDENGNLRNKDEGWELGKPEGIEPKSVWDTKEEDKGTSGTQEKDKGNKEPEREVPEEKPKKPVKPKTYEEVNEPQIIDLTDNSPLRRIVQMYLRPDKLIWDGLVKEAEMFDEFEKAGEKALERTEKITEEYKDNELFSMWDPLNEYLRTPGKTGSTMMDEFADHYMAWYNDELEDTMLDKLSELLSDEDFDVITDAMSAWKNGELIYNDQDRMKMLDAMDRMLTLVEQEMGIGSGSGNSGNSEMVDAAKGMKTVPGAIERAVARGMSGIAVTIDGDILMGYVNNRQATMIG